MQEIVKSLDSFSKWLNNLVYRVTGCLILVEFIIVIYGILFRYLLNNPLPWVLPISRIILIWSGLLGISIAFREGEHVAVKGIVHKMPLMLKKAILVFGYMSIIIYLFILVWKGFPIAFQATQLIMITAKIQIPGIWAMMAVPISATINLIHLLPVPLLIQRELEEEKNLKELK